MDKVLFFLLGVKICVKKGNLLNERVDAIVKPINFNHPFDEGILKRVKKKSEINLSNTGWIESENLPSKYIIYTQTIDMKFKKYKIIQEYMKRSFKICDELKVKSMSFPGLEFVSEKLDSKKIAEIMVEETLNYLSKKFEIEEINFVLNRKKDYENFSSVFEGYLRNLTKKTYKNPIPTVDIIIEYGNGIVLIERKNYPFGWAIPGGFVEYGESCEETAIREAKEETGLDVEDLKQFKTYSRPGRDPRFHTISTVFIAKGKGNLKSGDDAKNASIFNRENLPKYMAFDHKKILIDYYKHKFRS